MNRGVVFAVLAYLIWGLLPAFWKAMGAAGALEILAHRIFWSVAVLALVVTFRKTWSEIRALGARYVGRLLFAGFLLAVNWVTYIWAVNAGHVVDSSLGYFITPLFNVGLGVLILHERLERVQWVAVSVAAAGVAWMTFRLGSLPWIALVLATTFSLYGFMKKKSIVAGPIEGLLVELSLVAIPALSLLVVLGVGGDGSFVAGGWGLSGLLARTGVATVLPLALFGAAVHRIDMSMIGVLQYIAPSLQFLIGVVVYSEEVSGDELIGFVLVWIGLAIFTGHSLTRARRRRLQPAPV